MRKSATDPLLVNHLWLRHGEGASKVPVEQRLQPATALLLVPRGLDANRQELGVPRVGSVVAKDDRGQGRLAQDLVHQA
jgi:hypothetical protein